MPTYRTQIIATLDKGTVVQVQSPLCPYHVSERNGELVVFGPGVEESFTVGEEIPAELPTESRALLAVLLWEA